MVRNTPFYCLLTAMIARTTLAASVIWCLAALFSGQGNFITHSMWLTWITCLGLFILNQILLKKERTSLVIVVADIIGCIVLTGIIYGVFSEDNPVITFFMGMCVFIGAMSHVLWIYRGFSDYQLTMNVQFLALTAGMQLATAELMMKEASWAAETIAVIVLQLIASAMSKNSGICNSENRFKTQLKNAGICIIVIILMLFAGFTAYAAAVPAANFISLLCDAAAAAGRAIMTAIGYIYIFLTSIFNSSKVSDPTGGSGGGGNENAYWGEATGNLDFVKVVFMGIIIVFLLVILIAVLDSLRRMLMKKVGGTAGGRAVRKSDESILMRLIRFFKETAHRLKISIILLRYPHSVATLLVRLEKKCSKKADFKRKNGETAREFIIRTAEHVSDAEMEAVLRSFADEVDAAFYSREKNYLKEFSQYKKMLKTLKNSLTTHV